MLRIKLAISRVDHPRSSMLYILACMYVCVSICYTITFESLHVGSSFLPIWYISRGYVSGSYMKVIGSRSQKQIQSKALFLLWKTSI